MSYDDHVTVRVGRRCRHGITHPHTVSILGVYPPDDSRWCTEGDFAVYTLDQLAGVVSGVLSTQTPRLTTDDTTTKTHQIVEAVQMRLREGAVV